VTLHHNYKVRKQRPTKYATHNDVVVTSCPNSTSEHGGRIVLTLGMSIFITIFVL